jgi:hypothetical protein
MESHVAAPEDHPVIPGAGGFRKARWAQRGKGKSGGVRVIYFFVPEPGQIFMAAIYAKARMENLSVAESECPRKACVTDQEGNQGRAINHAYAQLEHCV